jgi:hypothetical protein
VSRRALVLGIVPSRASCRLTAFKRTRRSTPICASRTHPQTKAAATAPDEKLLSARRFRPACSRVVPLRSNGPATGSFSIVVEGSMLGYKDRSVAIRVGQSACENSKWISMTSVSCRIAAGGGQTRSMDGAVVVTVANGQVARPVTGYFTYDMASISTVKRSNQARARPLPKSQPAPLSVVPTRQTAPTQSRTYALQQCSGPWHIEVAQQRNRFVG